MDCNNQVLLILNIIENKISAAGAPFGDLLH